MLEFIKRLFGIAKADIDSIVADIRTKIEHLHAVAEAHAVAREVQVKIMGEAILAKQSAETEYARAKFIASKLETLISG
jgi:hypothetical protein